MKHQFKNNHNLLFPVNYLKSQPETTTMTKAIAFSPQSFFTDLNFPDYLGKISSQLKQMMHLFATIVAYFSTSGSLFPSPFGEKSGVIFKKLFSPIIMFILKIESILVHHLTIMQDDFFRFMDSFVMMDIDALQPAIVSEITYDAPFSHYNVVSGKGKKLYRNILFQTHLANIKNMRQAIHKAKHNETKKRSFINIFAGLTTIHENRKSIFVIKRGSRLKSLYLINFYNPLLKLPLKIIFNKIAAFNHRICNRLFAAMDSVITTEHPQNQFVYDY